MSSVQERPSQICPICGGANDPDAVFCANAACHKALGDFKYVLEELKTEARWHETLAERVVNAIGKPHFLGVHLLWFSFWVAVNTGVLVMVRHFDQYPFSLLGIILSMETIFITGFVLISENRQNAHSDKRAELDYEVNIRTYRKINEMEALLHAVLNRLEDLEGDGQREPRGKDKA